MALLIFLKAQTKHGLTSLATNSSFDKSRANKMVTAITLLFVLMTLLSSLCNIFYNKLLKQEWGYAVVQLGDALGFSYHAFSFPILMVTNVKFRQEFFFILKLIGFRDPKRDPSVTVAFSLNDDILNWYSFLNTLCKREESSRENVLLYDMI